MPTKSEVSLRRESTPTLQVCGETTTLRISQWSATSTTVSRVCVPILSAFSARENLSAIPHFTVDASCPPLFLQCTVKFPLAGQTIKSLFEGYESLDVVQRQKKLLSLTKLLGDHMSKLKGNFQFYVVGGNHLLTAVNSVLAEDRIKFKKLEVLPCIIYLNLDLSTPNDAVRASVFPHSSHFLLSGKPSCTDRTSDSVLFAVVSPAQPNC